MASVIYTLFKNHPLFNDSEQVIGVKVVKHKILKIIF